MLQSLSIRDVVLIQSLDLDFTTGLVVLTGETGAGKSILLDSLGLALGNRADTGLIRQGAERASVTATFSLRPCHPVYALLEEHELEIDGESLIIRRILTSEGRNKCFINDQPVTQSFLKTAAQHLIEIHGQFDNLLDSKTHARALDHHGDVNTHQIETTFQELKACRLAYKKALENLESSKDREAFLRFSKTELEELAPKCGEEEELIQARARVANRAKISEAAGQADQALNRGGLVSQIVEAQRSLQKVQEHLPDVIAPLVEALDRALVELDEATAGVSDLLNEVEGDSQSLESLDDRLHALRAMAKKHHVAIDALPQLLEDITQELSQIDRGDEYIEDLKLELGKAQATYEREAQNLTETRQKAGKQLEAAIRHELIPLKLGQTQFMVKIERLPENQWTAHGWDHVEFHVATNPGSAAGSIAKVASGGELSRLMLALKVILSRTTQIPSLIFDEIDSGTGGAVAAAIGSRLKSLSTDMQVLVITHSPQVAALGDQHLQVLKMVEDDKTTTHVTELPTEQRLEEVARMLSGTEITTEARAQAKQLMGAA